MKPTFLINLKITVIIIATLFTVTVAAQSEKEVVKNKIFSREVTEINYESGMDEKVPEELKVFNEKGQVIELKEYDATGKLSSWVKFSYFEDGEIHTETYLDKKAKLLQKIVYVYDNGLKREKLYYDAKNRLVKKKIYEYTFRK